MKNFFATILIFLGSVLPAEENPLGITLFGSFLHTDRVPNALFFFSDIQRNDSFQLRRALRTHEIDTIVLTSNGGSVWEGLNMAGIIFDKKMTAYVPPLPEGVGCFSACAYMFFAGQTRLAVGGLGVHQIGAYDAGVDSEKRKVGETQQATQFTTSEVIGFLNEFGTPPWVYERMFRSREIYVFTEDEKKDLNQGQLDPTIKSSIDGFLVQLRAELEKAAKTEPKAPAVEGFDKTDREMVKALQVRLNEAKCSAGVADGVWGRQTNAAAERFAKANKLTYLGPASIGSAFFQILQSDSHMNCVIEVQSDIVNAPRQKKASGDRLEGIWKTEVDDGKYAHIQMAPCGDAICGTILKSFDANGEYRSPNQGKFLVRKMKPKGGGKYDGEVWRPSNNKIYIGKLELEGDFLRVGGCAGVVCSWQTWHRIR